MAEETRALEANEAVPTGGTLVTDEVLYMNQGSIYRLAQAFAGMGNPTVVWGQMVQDTAAAMAYYRELEEKDEDVGAAIEEVKLSVLSRDFCIKPADDSSLAQEIAADVQNQLTNLPDWDNALDAMLDAPFMGYSVTEKIFDISAGQVRLLDLMDCPQELFSFAPQQGYPQTGPLRMSQYAGGIGVPVPENKFCVISSRMRSRNRKGRPLLRNVYWPSWFKRNAQTMWMRLAERGPGSAVVQYPQGAEDGVKKQALAAAEALVTQVAFAMPENFSFVKELLTSARSADPATYSDLYDTLEKKIYRRIVGETMTSHGSDGGKGTQALGEVHADTKEVRSVRLTMQLEKVINRQIITQLVMWNYGPDAPMPRAEFDKSAEEDLLQRIQIDKSAQAMGMPVTQDYVSKTYSLPVPGQTDVILQPQQNAMALPGAAPEFSEARERVIGKEVAEFDTLFDQLRGESMKQFRKRVDDIAAGAEISMVR